MDTKRQALVIGANGVIGRRLIEELTGQGWQVVGVSRRGDNRRRGCATFRLICWMRRRRATRCGR